jgi:hypothetical protein
MADYDPEVMRELMGNLDALNASLGPLSMRMGQMAGAIDAQGNAISKEGEAIKKAASYREGESKAVQATRQAHLELEKASQHLKQGLTSAGSAAVSFADALLKGEGKFSSYNKAIDGAGEAAWQLGKAFGPLGMAIGGAVKAISKVAQVMTEQADAQNEFVGEMYKMGAISGQSSEKLTDMARAAGYAAEDLNKLVPIFKKAGAGLTTLGGTAGEGASVFGNLLKAANENERAFFRIGYSLEELQETQAEYLELQRQSGINLRQRGFDEDKLAKDSLKYAKNLRELSDLTGQSAETLKQEQMSARNAYENVIAARAEEAKIRQMEAELATTTDQARREQLQKEIDEMKNSSAVRNEAIGRMANDFGPEFGAQFGKVLRTGAFDESTKGLAVLGISAADLKKKFEGVQEGTPEFDALMAETAQDIRQRQDERIGQFNQSLQFGGEELGRALGLSKESVMRGGMIDPTDEEARRRAVQDEIDAKMEGNDTQRDLAAALVDNERRIKTAADELLDSMNPLTNGVDKTTLAMQALTVAAGVAAATMMMGGRLPGVNALKNVASRGVQAVRNVGTRVASSRVAQTATRGSQALNASRGMQVLGRLAGPLAAVAEVGKGVYSAMEGRERAEKNLAEGKITQEEAGRRKTQETAEGTGQAIGGAGGALAGAAAGAAIGSVVPVIGTAIGGIIGGIAGAWLGSKGGEEIGGAIGEKMTISPEMKEQNERNRELVSQMGIYNENWLGASEVNMEKLKEGIEAGTVTNDMVTAMIQDNDLTDEQMEELTALQAEQQEKLNENLERQKAAAEAITNSSEESLLYSKEKTEAMATHAIAVRELEKKLAEEKNIEDKKVIAEQLRVAKENLEASKKFEETIEGPFESAISGIGNMFSGLFGFGGKDDKDSSPGFFASLFGGGGAGGASGEGSTSSVPGGGALAGASGEGGASGPAGPETDPDTGPADRLQQDPSKARLISSKPDNVKVGPKADLTGVDNQLLQRFFTAANDFGKEVRVNSAYRGDQYQAQLWVRGRILGEPGIHTPARPKNTTQINYKGKNYTVEGSGRGSKHREGDALDISTDRGAFDPFLARYGLVRPYKRKDPPHVEMMKAKEGGLAMGPSSGYLAELHSNEMIVPLDSNSVLAKMGKTTPEDFDADKDGKASDAELMTMLSSKLDIMIDKLGNDDKEMVAGIMEKYLSQMIAKMDDSNDIQGKMLQYSKV